MSTLAPPIRVETIGVDTDWTVFAACAGQADLMYPDEVLDDNPEADIDWAPALSLCGMCPVRQECLAHAMRWNDVECGVLGGMTPESRRAYRRSQSQYLVPHGTMTGYVNHKCRCDQCMERNRTYRLDPGTSTQADIGNAQDHTGSDADDELARLLAEQADDAADDHIDLVSRDDLDLEAA